MSPIIIDSEIEEQPDEPGNYILTGVNPRFEFRRRFSDSVCTIEKLRESLNNILLETDKAFAQLSERKDGVLIVVDHHLWMPAWEQGRLALFHEKHSLEGREKISESANDPSWKDSLLWDVNERPIKRKEILDSLQISLNQVANEGLELFRLATAKKFSLLPQRQQTLVVPISEKNSLAAFCHTDELGRLFLRGKVAKIQAVEMNFRITLYNDVYREDVSCISLEEAFDDLEMPEYDEDDDLLL